MINHSANGQSEIIPGYLIDVNGDTLKGDLLLEPSNTINAKFKQGNNVTNLKELNTKAFISTNNLFILSEYEGEIRIFEALLQSDIILLKQIIDGDAYFYYQYLNSSIVKLEYEYTKQANSFQKFKGQLNLLFNDCLKIVQISKTKYQEVDLIGIFADYVKCKELKTSFKKSRIAPQINYLIYTGMSFSNFDITGNPKISSSRQTSLVEASFPRSNNLTFGLGLNLPLSRKKRFYTNLELLNKNTGTKSSINGYEFFLDLKQIKLNTSLAYKINKKKLSPFIEVGLSNGFFYKFKTNIEEFDRKYEQGIFSSVGLTYKNIFFISRYELSNGISNIVSFKTTFKTTYINIGIRF